MPLINTAPTARMHSHHEHVLKSPAAQKPEKPEAPSRPSTAAVTETRETPDKTRAKGVLRLLGEDHFKGVAAVRLRMNFQAELEQKDKLDRVYQVELIDEEGSVCASIEKTIYFRRK